MRSVHAWTQRSSLCTRGWYARSVLWTWQLQIAEVRLSRSGALVLTDADVHFVPWLRYQLVRVQDLLTGCPEDIPKNRRLQPRSILWQRALLVARGKSVPAPAAAGSPLLTTGQRPTELPERAPSALPEPVASELPEGPAGEIPERPTSELPTRAAMELPDDIPPDESTEDWELEEGVAYDLLDVVEQAEELRNDTVPVDFSDRLVRSVPRYEVQTNVL